MDALSLPDHCSSSLSHVGLPGCRTSTRLPGQEAHSRLRRSRGKRHHHPPLPRLPDPSELPSLGLNPLLFLWCITHFDTIFFGERQAFKLEKGINGLLAWHLHWMIPNQVEEHSRRLKIPRPSCASARNPLDPSKARCLPRSHNPKISCCTSLLLEPHSQRVLQILHCLLQGFHWISEVFLTQTQHRLVPLTNVVRTARIIKLFFPILCRFHLPQCLRFLVVAWFLYPLYPTDLFVILIQLQPFLALDTFGQGPSPPVIGNALNIDARLLSSNLLCSQCQLIWPWPRLSLVLRILVYRC